MRNRALQSCVRSPKVGIKLLVVFFPACAGRRYDICYNRTALKPRRYEWPPQPSRKSQKAAPVSLTANAVAKVKEIMAQQNPVPAGLRIGVVGGGCSGFSYSMQFENGAGMMDKTFDMDGLKVYVDATSVMYLNGCVVDYVETLEGAGFKFENPEREEHLRLRIVVQRVRRFAGCRLACGGFAREIKRPHRTMRPFVFQGRCHAARCERCRLF